MSTPNKILSRLPLLLLKIFHTNYKTKSEKYYIFYINTIKSPKTLQELNQVIIIMGVHIGDNKLVITTGPRTFYFDLPKDAGINLKHNIYFIIKHKKLLLEHMTKNEIRKLLPIYKRGNDIHEHGKP